MTEIPASVGLNLASKRRAPEQDRIISVIPSHIRPGPRAASERRHAAELIARETPGPRAVEPDSIDAASRANADRPSAADAHATDVAELLERANETIATMARSLARAEAERREWAAKLAEAQRPRQHGRIISLLLWMAGR